MNLSIWGVLVQSCRGALGSPSHGLWSKVRNKELLNTESQALVWYSPRFSEEHLEYGSSAKGG